MARSLGELAAQFGCDLVGEPSAEVTGVATLSNARNGQLSFFANKAYREQLLVTRATAVLIHPRFADDCPVAALVSDDPYLTYAHVASELHPQPAVSAGIHDSANVEADADIASSAEIAANANIESGASVGAGAFVGPGVYIGRNCSVGAYSRVLANATLVQDVQLGERCIIHPGAVLGSDGFGNAKGSMGWVKVPQVGGVRIGNDVEIGANTTVDRGAIDDTVIGDGARLDNLIQIAHNVQVGAHTAMAAFTGVSGSTIIGERCMFAGQAGIVGHLSICDDVVVGGATMISKDITEPGFYTGSFPGEKDRDWKRKVARFRRIDDLVKRVTILENLAGKESDGD
ncbi:MAG: UDP-3-O-(3-hydroxymyristoyl)glucosamine N-acyltransferase [Woeseiaceae bacterium]